MQLESHAETHKPLPMHNHNQQEKLPRPALHLQGDESTAIPLQPREKRMTSKLRPFSIARDRQP